MHIHENFWIASVAYIKSFSIQDHQIMINAQNYMNEQSLIIQNKSKGSGLISGSVWVKFNEKKFSFISEKDKK